MQASIAPPQTATYDTDFVAWTHQQAALLRQGRLGSLDIQNIAEEIEEIGKGVRREFLSRTVILIMHLLKWQFQPDYRGEAGKTPSAHSAVNWMNSSTTTPA